MIQNPPPKPKKAPVAARLATGTFLGVLLSFVFLLSLVTGAVLHLDLPVSRRAGADLLEDYLSKNFRGGFQLGSLTRLERGGVTVENFEVFDPSARRVLSLGTLRVNVDLFGILDRVLGGYEKVSIEIREVSADDCEVVLLTSKQLDEAGQPLSHPSIADAFEPISAGETKSTTKGRPVRIWFPDVSLQNVYARMNLGDNLALQAKVRRAKAKVLVTDKGVSIDVARFLLNASGIAGADATAHGEIHVRAPGPIWGEVAGHIGEIPLSQTFRLEGQHIEMRGKFPEVRPSAARPLLGSWPLDRTISIDNYFHGTLSKVAVDLAIRHPSDDPEDFPPIRVTGFVEPTENLRADLTVQTRGLNLQGYLSDLPESRLDSTSQVKLALIGGAPEASVDSKIDKGVVAGVPTPNAHVIGSWSPSAFVADAHLEEEGAKVKVHAAQTGKGPLTYRVDLEEIDVAKNTRLAAVLPDVFGRAQGTVEGQLEGDILTAKANIKAQGIRFSDVTVAGAVIQAEASMPLSAPKDAVGSVEVRATDANLSGPRLSTVRITAQGPLLRPEIRAEAKTPDDITLTAKTNADLEERILRKVAVELSGRGKPIELTAESISFRDERVAVNDFSMKSTGEIHGDIDIGANGGTIDVQAHKLSVSRIFESLGFAKNEFGGDLSGKVDLRIGAHPEGMFELTVENGAFRGVDGLLFSANGTVKGRETKGSVSGSVRGVGSFESTWDATLGGELLQTSAYERATGSAQLRIDDLNLQGLYPLLGGETGVKMLTGTVTANLEVERERPDQSPAFEGSLVTRQLGGRIEVDGEEHVFIGADLNLAVSARAGEDQVEAALRVIDDRGTFFSASGALEVPLRSWFTKLPSADAAVATLKSAPLDVVVVLPRRNLSRWPAFIPKPLDQGTLAARLAVTGSFLAPELSAVVTATRLDGPESPFSDPIDVEFNGRYKAASGDLRANATFSQKASRIASVQVDVILPAEHLQKLPEAPVPLYTGSVMVQLESTPLQSFRELARKKARGVIQGSVFLQRDAYMPTFGAEVNLRDMAFGEHHLGDALLEARTNGTKLTARAQFDDDYGNLNVAAELAVAPTVFLFDVAEAQPINITLEASEYDAAVLLPAVSGMFDELSGSLTGKLRATSRPPQVAGGSWSTELSGAMKMTDGVLTPSALGMRLEEVRFNLTANREGEFNVIRLKNIAARAESRQHNLNAQAELFFRNLDLARGSFQVSPDAVPFKSGGAEMAVLSGVVDGEFQVVGSEMRMVVSVDELTAELPPSGDANLIDLEENDSIQVLQREKPKEAEEDDEPAMVLVVKVRLGNGVRVKSEVLDLRLRGTPEMRLAEELQLRGGIELVPGGRINVMGRRFLIERGMVQFDAGDPANPQISAVASWRAPNGVLVRANLEGTAEAPVLSWSSEPALPGGEAAIISLVIGGGSGQDQKSTGISSIAVAANEAIGQSGVSGLEFYTTQEAAAGDGRMASMNDSTWDSYTAAFPINDKLWFEGSLSRSGAGAGPQGGRRHGVSGTLDWRFHPNWSLRTEIGTLGTGLDLVWQYRY